MQLSEMIHIKEAEAGGWGDIVRQHDVDILHLRTKLHRHDETFITATVPGIKRPETNLESGRIVRSITRELRTPTVSG